METERFVINSHLDGYEVDRAQWVETRSRYIFERTGADATIDHCVDSRREGALDPAWQVDSLSRVARARVGPDFVELLRELNRQPTAIRTAVADLSNAPGWHRLKAEGDHRNLCCALADQPFKFALAPDESTPLAAFVPDSVLMVQGAGALAMLGAWLPDLFNHHLRFRKFS